jgi:hypothetical protein
MWHQIRTRAYEKAKPLQGPLSRAFVDALEGGAVTIRIVDPPQEEYVRSKSAAIEDAIADLLGTRLRVIIRCSGSAAPARSRNPVAPREAPPAGRASSAPGPGQAQVSPPASANAGDGELDLIEYALHKMSGAPGETDTV